MKHKTLMVQGTTSDAGKSALVTGLCRYFYRQGIKVAPFKPQNMALNSAVTADGGEIGRAQAVQAAACCLEPHTDMNPVLLKPNSDQTAQVIIHGKALANQDAKSYHDYKKTAMAAVLESYERLRARYDLVIVEGAGSPAEINLREGDIANMGFAERVDCPVILIADIDRGGVFAHVIGTLELLSPSERDRIIGFVINRFRGDMSLLTSGLEWLEQKTGKPVLGVLPYLHHLYLESEDSISVLKSTSADTHALKVIVPGLPRMSNHTDFDPLIHHGAVNIEFAKKPDRIGGADLIILPGSKSVRDDLAWLKNQGWVEHINRHLRYGGRVLGICGGFQMLGNKIHDPAGIEGVPGASDGLKLLNMETTLQSEKCLRQVSGVFYGTDIRVTGYEIHAGISRGPDLLKRPVFALAHGLDGARSEDNLVQGTYVHALFDSNDACNRLLDWAGSVQQTTLDIEQLREGGIELMADTLSEAMNFSLF